MKNTAIILTIILAGAIQLSAQDEKYYIPSALEIPFAAKEGKDAYYLSPLVYPLGWSKDGNFAYFTYLTADIDGMQNTVFRFYIQNLVDDKVVWETTFSKGQAVSLGEIWKLYKNDIEKNLTKYKIVQYEAQLSAFPVKTKTANVDYQVLVTQSKSSLGYTYINAIEFHVYNAIGDKIIYKEKNAQAVRITVPGYLLSPFEPRMAVFLLKIKRSDQEGIYPVDVQVIGCHLTAGFGKPEVKDEPMPDNEFEIEIDEADFEDGYGYK